MDIQTIAILGAGKVGIVLAQLAVKAGYSVYVAGSGEPEKIQLSVKVLAPGAHAVESKEAVQKADVVILALPLGKFRNIPSNLLDGKLVIDAMNYWWEVDGPRTDILPDMQTSSEAVQAYFKDAHIVKALSHMGYHELFDEARQGSAENRKAIAIAGDDAHNASLVSDFIKTLGFEPLFIGKLSAGILLEPGNPGFGTNLSAVALKKKLGV